jgi:hypothetical protein
MKTYLAVGIPMLIASFFAMMFCVTSFENWAPCTNAMAWCGKWSAELSPSVLVAYGYKALLGVAVVLVTVAIYGRSLRGRAFNTGDKVSQYYEASRSMLVGVLGLFYTVKILAWGHLDSLTLLLAGFIGVFAVLIFVPGLWNLLRWLMLESKGMQWATTPSGGDALFRLIFRRADGSGVVSLTTHAERVVEELNYSRHRRVSVIASIIALIAAFAARPSAYQYSEYLGWALTYLVLAPLVAKVGTDMIYTLAYKAGGQFITGAAVLDTPPGRIDPGQLSRDKVYGDGAFEEATDMVDRFGGGGRW